MSAHTAQWWFPHLFELPIIWIFACFVAFFLILTFVQIKAQLSRDLFIRTIEELYFMSYIVLWMSSCCNKQHCCWLYCCTQQSISKPTNQKPPRAEQNNMWIHNHPGFLNNQPTNQPTKAFFFFSPWYILHVNVHIILYTNKPTNKKTN